MWQYVYMPAFGAEALGAIGDQIAADLDAYSVARCERMAPRALPATAHLHTAQAPGQCPPGPGGRLFWGVRGGESASIT
jgi:hypothetical protein